MISSKKINEGENKSNKGVFTLLFLAEEQRSLSTPLLSMADYLAAKTAAMVQLIQFKKKSSCVLVQYFKFYIKIIKKRDFVYHLRYFP